MPVASTYAIRLACLIIELNAQPDHVHLLVKVPPKRSLRNSWNSKRMHSNKGFKKFPDLKKIHFG